MFWVDVLTQEVYVGVLAIDCMWEDIQDIETVSQIEPPIIWKH